MKGYKSNKKFLLAAEIIILALIAIPLYRLVIKNNEINTEIANLETNITDLERREVELNELIQYFDSQAYLEQKARLELGLQKPGESVVILNYEAPIASNQRPTPANANVAFGSKQESSRLGSWFNYLFPN